MQVRAQRMPICPVFGAHMNPSAESAPTRIRVRDAHLTKESSEKYKSSGQLMEQKTENLVNRKTGTARDPPGERVPPALNSRRTSFCKSTMRTRPARSSM